MRLTIGNTVIADSNDGFTKWTRADKPELRLRAVSTELIGRRYARNKSNSWGMTLMFTVIVGRQFKNYATAEAFALSHIADCSSGIEGFLTYTSVFQKTIAFRNAALESVRFTSEIGISTETEYVFRCGEPIAKPSFAVKVKGYLITLLGKIVTIKS